MNRFIAKLLLLIVCFYYFFFYVTIHVNAQIINEISSGSSDDWVEIYNNTSRPIDLSQYKLVDAHPNEKILTGILDPESFTAIDWYNKLDKNGDTVYLKKIADNTDVDFIKYGSSDSVCVPDANQSIGRYENGNVIERFEFPTKGATNIGANILPCPTPSPSPSPTPQPTIAPTPTPTVTKTPTAVPLQTKTPTPVPTKSPPPSPKADRIAGASAGDATPTNEPEVMGLSFTKPLSKNKNLTLPIIFISSGVLLIGFAVLQLINAKKTAQDSKSMGTFTNMGGNNI